MKRVTHERLLERPNRHVEIENESGKSGRFCRESPRNGTYGMLRKTSRNRGRRPTMSWKFSCMVDAMPFRSMTARRVGRFLEFPTRDAVADRRGRFGRVFRCPLCAFSKADGDEFSPDIPNAFMHASSLRHSRHALRRRGSGHRDRRVEPSLFRPAQARSAPGTAAALSIQRSLARTQACFFSPRFSWSCGIPPPPHD